MYCRDVAACYAEIDAYLQGDTIGYPLLIDTEDLDSHRAIMFRLESNPQVQCKRISGACQDDQIPDVMGLLQSMAQPGKRALFGFSQFFMLQSFDSLHDALKQVRSMTIHGHLIVLLYQCRSYMQTWLSQDPRLGRRV